MDMSDNSQDVKEFYDDDAATYDERFETEAGDRDDAIHQEVVQSFMNSLDPDARLFELGCGTGRFTATMTANSRSVAATDISREMLKQTREEVSNDAFLDIVQADVSELPYREGSFDAGIMINVLGHLPDPQSAFAEISRILGDNGKILFNYPNLFSLYFPIGVYVNARERSIHGDVYTHWYTEREIHQLLETAGLQEVERFGHVHTPRRDVPVVTPVLERLDRATRQSGFKKIAPVQFVIGEL